MFFDFLCGNIHCVNEMRQKFAHCVKSKRREERKRTIRRDFPRHWAGGIERLKLLFEQNEDSFVKLFDRKAVRRGGENGIVTGNGTQNTFRFAQ
jgi:hypothetical protein